MKTNGRQRDWEGPSAMTNYEKIKAMSVEEMAEQILCKPQKCSFCAFFGKKRCDFSYSCLAGHIVWLQKEADANE
jgi:hypothetical protein